MSEHEDFEVDPSECLQRLMSAVESEFEDELADKDNESADGLLAALSILLVQLAEECSADPDELVQAARDWLDDAEDDDEDEDDETLMS